MMIFFKYGASVRLFSTRALLPLALILIALTGCQDPVEEIIDPPENSIIEPNSSIATLLQRVSLNDGSSDNIVDSASCISLAFPFTVNANGLEIFVDSPEDLELIEDIFDEFDEDDDILEILFPVTVILPDHSQFTIDNKDAFEDLVDSCEDAPDQDIECLDFEYPISISTYDTVNQTSSVIVLDNDEELYGFLDDLDHDDLVGFNFPITVILADSSTVVITSNHQLEELIEDIEDTCDEDDDFDHHDDGGHHADTVVVGNVITKGQWVVANYNDSGENETNDFQGYVLEFTADGAVTAVKDSQQLDGSWDEFIDNSIHKVLIDFNEQVPFNELNDDWDLIEITETRMELRDVSGGDGSTDLLVLERL